MFSVVEGAFVENQRIAIRFVAETPFWKNGQGGALWDWQAGRAVEFAIDEAFAENGAGRDTWRSAGGRESSREKPKVDIT